MAQWHTVPSLIGHDGFGEIDPYLDWAFPDGVPVGGAVMAPAVAPGTAGTRYPILVRLADSVSIQDFANGSFFPPGVRPANWSTVVHVAQVYAAGGGGLAGRYCTALVLEEFIDYFRSPLKPEGRALIQAVKRLCVSAAILKGTEAAGGPAPPSSAVPSGIPEPGTVVVGIIDDGIPFASDRFRTPANHTRVEYVWLQDAKGNAAASRYGYGRSLSKGGSHGDPGIDALLTSSTYSGLVDEDEVYAKAGALDFGARDNGLELRTLALRASHGAHVMDIACGYRPGEAPRHPGTAGEDSRPIVCVQLPAATREGTSGASLDTQVIDGIRYILDKADEIARARNCGRLPVVINLSYGTIAGRHDGTSDIERAIDEIISARAGTSAPVQVVLPAGNNRAKRCHAVVYFDPADTSAASPTTRTLKWRVPPDSRAQAHLEIWLPQGTAPPASRVRVRIKPPFGPWSPPLGEDTPTVHVLGDTPDKGLCELRYAYVPAPTGRGAFIITLKPTEATQDPLTGALDDNTAPVGLWQVEIENLSLSASAVLDAWIQRNDTRFGYLPFGRQSYFEDESYVVQGNDGRIPELDHPASAIKRGGTLSAIATGSRSVVIGGFDLSTMTVAPYSGEGPTLYPGRSGPDAVAPSDDSIVHGGLIAGGTRSGSVIALNGTSVAAPQVTRLIADLLADGVPANRRQIQQIAEDQELGRLNRPTEARGGRGRLVLREGFRFRGIE